MTTNTTPATVTAAVEHMNAWEAEGRALRAEAEAAAWPENLALQDQLQSRNWGDVASDFARWEDDPSDAIEFRVADAPEWLVCYNDQTREWVAVYSPEEEWENREETSLSSYPLDREDRERLQAAKDALYGEGNSVYVVERGGEIGIMVWGEESPRATARLQ